MNGVSPATAPDLEASIVSIAARCLRIPEGALDPEMPLALLGLDSLGAIELGAELEQLLGFAVSPDLVSDCTDIRSLAACLRRMPVRPSPDDEFERMIADAVLPDEIRLTAGRRAHRGASLLEARTVLLTGATGFLGAAIVHELIERSSAEILCLVRPTVPNGHTPDLKVGPTGAVSRDRVRRCLDDYGVHIPHDEHRIRVIEGDLRQPRLGLTDSAFASLASEVDAICHAGATVNWVSSYATLHASNVAGTLELLRLACLAGGVPFHFVSSLSVCYSTSAPEEIDESFDPLPHLRGIHLGYAQTKVVAEALVRQAGAHGLPVTIARPAIISGHSCSGAFNPDDVLAALVKGSVRMGIAPDLDWQLDCQPVDVVAREIVGLRPHAKRAFHLAHSRPRHWRECVLWMRLYGYPIRLVSYHEWLARMDRETRPAAAPDHPLRPLRGFFLERPAGAGGLTLPELYEESRRTSARTDWTQGVVKSLDVDCPPLDAALLDTYFGAYVKSGHLPPPNQVRPNSRTPELPSSRAPELPSSRQTPFTPAFFERIFGGGTRVRSVQPLASGSDHSIVSELTAWHSRTPSGLFRFRLELETNGRAESRDVVVKVKPRDRRVIEVGQAVADVCDESIGRAYARWGDQLGFSAGHTRELAIYAQQDPRFTDHAPALLGSLADERSGRWVLVLEQVADGVLMDSAERPEQWTAAHLDMAIRGLAALQAIWYGREAQLRQEPWIGHVASAASMADMSELWTALANHAAPAFSSWAHPEIAAIQHRLVDGVGTWWRALESGPRTLIHHDFNPRNICLRIGGLGVRGLGSSRLGQFESADVREAGNSRDIRLCAYDWELATIGAPQRDLAELLCFVLPADAGREAIDGWIECHRLALMAETGAAIDADAWRRGFHAAVCDLMVSRLPMYALIHRIRRQPFLPRVVRTWWRLYKHTEEHGSR